jgi:hypothetical protein
VRSRIIQADRSKRKVEQGNEREVGKIDPAQLVLYKSTILLVARWSFERDGFFLNPEILLKSFTIDVTPAFGRLDIGELSFDEAFVSLEQLDS